MAKLKAPLLSLGASGAIGKSVVFFPWKGIDAAREYVVPANPKSADQVTQRGYMTQAVSKIHAAEAAPTYAINSADRSAWSLLAAALGITMTWFNSIVRMWVKQRIAAKYACIFSGATITEASAKLTVKMAITASIGPEPTTGNLKYGTSKTALINTLACTVAELLAGKDITSLENGVQYFVQYQPTTGAEYVGSNSGIYHGTPHA